jgi:hypothetical protein
MIIPKIDVCIAKIDKVNDEQATFDAQVLSSASGFLPHRRSVILTYESFSQNERSGLVADPQIGDYVMLIKMGADYFFLKCVNPPVLSSDKRNSGVPDDIRDSASKAKGKDKDGDKGNFHKKTIDKEGDKPLNMAYGRRKLPPGSKSLLGNGGNHGIIVTPDDRVIIFSSQAGFREYSGASLDGTGVPTIVDFCLNYILRSSGYVMDSHRNVDGKKTKSGDITTTVEEDFFQDTGERQKIYYNIKSGTLEDRKDFIRVEAVREPEKNIVGGGEPSTKKVKLGFGAGELSKFKGNIKWGGKEISTPSPENLKPGFAGLSHKSLYQRSYKKSGKVIEATKDSLEFQTEKDFIIFADKKISMISEDTALIFGSYGVDIITEEALRLGAKSVHVKMEDKFEILSGSIDDELPSREEGML